MTAAKIDPDKILGELNQLWISLGQQDGAASSQGVLRACAMTLVVITEAPPDDASLVETIAALMRFHPSRAIVIRLRGGTGRELSASVNAQCWKPFGSRQQICCELIEIAAARPALPDLPAVLRGLTAPDLPVILWFQQPELLDLPPLGIGDKLIVNTAGLSDAPRVFAQIRTLAGSSRLVADLSWTRLTRWRETIAYIFANPARQPKIPAINRVTVTHTGDATPVRALYLMTWLQTVLGERPAFHFQRAAQAWARSEVQGVVLEGPGIEISIELQDEESAQIQLDGFSMREAFSAPNEYELLREELSMLGRDPTYEAVRQRLAG